MKPARRYCLLDLVDDEYKIICRDRTNFQAIFTELVRMKYEFLVLDDRGRAHPIAPDAVKI